MMQPAVSHARLCSVWIGGLILDAGHVVAIDPRDDAALIVSTKTKTVRLRVSMRSTAPTPPRVIVESQTALDPMPDAVIIGVHDVYSRDALHVVPVQRTQDSWITQGVSYAVPIDKLVSFAHLCAWLDKLGRPELG